AAEARALVTGGRTGARSGDSAGRGVAPRPLPLCADRRHTEPVAPAGDARNDVRAPRGHTDLDPARIVGGIDRTLDEVALRAGSADPLELRLAADRTRRDRERCGRSRWGGPAHRRPLDGHPRGLDEGLVALGMGLDVRRELHDHAVELVLRVVA